MSEKGTVKKPAMRANTSRMAEVKRPVKKTLKTAKEEPENPNALGTIWREVCRKHKGLMTAMILLMVMAVVLFIISLSGLRPQNTVVIVGYGDVYGEVAGISGGYRRESWLNMFAFPILAVVFGLIQNLLALKIYKKYGRDVATVVVIATMALVIFAFVTLFRLMGEW